MELEGVNIHGRINKALDTLNALNFQGYHEITAIAPKIGMAMTELILLEQEVVKAEQAMKEAEEQHEQQA